MPIKMNVIGITVDPSNNSPIVVLKEADGERMLPIWIGILEAAAIATQLEKVELTRPMTHDLFNHVLSEIGVKIRKIVVNNLDNNTYFARIFFIGNDGKEFDVDARPSDSLALALRGKAEIWVDEGVLDKAKDLDLKAMDSLRKTMDEKWKEVLEEIDPDDLGKYRM
jgi:bifunctional DNase/RNase